MLPAQDSDTLIEVTGLGKKFCRDFRQSLVYALQDVGGELLGARNDNQDLRKGEFWALRDISFSLKRGETLGLLGANGAGKSTLLKLLNGLIKPSKGRIAINGSMQALIELGGAFSPQLSARENIFAAAAMIGMTTQDITEKFDSIIDFAELHDFVDAPVGTFSSGMKVRLGFAIATCIRPDILILDEVLAVGDARFRSKSLDKVQDMRRQASSIMFVSHNIYQIKRLCDRCLVLDKGVLVADAPTDQAIEVYNKLLGTHGKSGFTAEEDVNNAEGVAHFSLKVMQHEKQVQTVDSASPFSFNIACDLKSDVRDLWLDIGISDSVMNYLVLQTHKLEHAGKRSVMLQVDFPALPFGNRDLFPYAALVDGETGNKIIKYNMQEPVTFRSHQTSQALLHPEIRVSAKWQ